MKEDVMKVDAMKRAITVGVVTAALLTLVGLPNLYAIDPPAEPIKLDYMAQVVMYPHAPHVKGLECQTCHHTWDGESKMQKCSSSGCHDVFDKRDRSEKSFYAIAHGRGSETAPTCISCHKEEAKKNKDLRKQLTSCRGSACHPG